MVTVEVHKSDKPNTVVIKAMVDGDQLMKSPMKCNAMNKKSIESQIRKDLKSYNLDLVGYGGISVLFFVDLSEK